MLKVINFKTENGQHVFQCQFNLVIRVRACAGTVESVEEEVCCCPVLDNGKGKFWKKKRQGNIVKVHSSKSASLVSSLFRILFSV